MKSGVRACIWWIPHQASRIIFRLFEHEEMLAPIRAALIMALNWFRVRRKALTIIASCPRKCVDQRSDDVVVVSKEDLMENLDIEGNLHLPSEAKLLLCRRCGCVWQRTFDAQSFKFHDEVLGTFRNTKTEPDR